MISQGVGTVAADLLLTGFMMVSIAYDIDRGTFNKFLRGANGQYGLSKNKTGWSNTDKFINRLIRAAIETQVPGTLVSCTLPL